MNYELTRRTKPEPIPENLPLANASDQMQATEPAWYEGMGEALADIIPNAVISTTSSAIGAYEGFLGEDAIKVQLRNSAIEAQELGIKIDDIDAFVDRQYKSLDTGSRRLRQLAKEEYTPSDSAVGAAGQLIFGVGTELTKMAMAAPLGAAAPAAYAANTGIHQYQSMMDEGVDKDTALDVAFTTALTSAIGMKVPMAIGKTRLQSGLAGAGINEAMFVSENATIQYILDNADYGDIAQRFDPWDPLGSAINVITGGVFGYAAGKGAKAEADGEAKPNDIDNKAKAIASKPINLTHAIADAARTKYFANRVYQDQPAPKSSVRLTTQSKQIEKNVREALDNGEKINISKPIADANRVEQEQVRLVDSMHQVMQKYEGDPLQLFMTIGDDPQITVRRGKIKGNTKRGYKSFNETAEIGTDFGLVKIAIKHMQSEDPRFSVTDDDLRMIPRIVREFNPIAESRSGSMTWRVKDSEDRELVLSSKKIKVNGKEEDTLLTFYVQNPVKRRKEWGLSKRKANAANPTDELKTPAVDTPVRLPLSSRSARPTNEAERITTQGRGIADSSEDSNPATELTTPFADTPERLPLSSRPSGSLDSQELITTQGRGTTEPDSNISENKGILGQAIDHVRRWFYGEGDEMDEVEVPEPSSRLEQEGLTKEATGVDGEELLTKELDAVVDYREDGTPITGRELIESETVAADEIDKFAQIMPEAAECVYRNNGIM